MTDRLEFAHAGATAGTVRHSNAGGVDLRLDAHPVVAGKDAAQFAIAEATCSDGLVIRQDEACTVTIVFTPGAGPGLRVAVLRLAHDWIGAGANVPLRSEEHTSELQSH